ncbi:MAG: FG-GAP-like repeat-containing protein [Bacteroidia bacterium]|nr:FG-GAP-like repeat-containing protein [Bacteroidia bacterium]MCX7764672.1 FG-GAP-like repeat-containing protein [Bacteroidia bacterium]MDW8057640.1 FG-GAP-like repeat-containing protein [Bacteroidia bacterium]
MRGSFSLLIGILWAQLLNRSGKDSTIFISGQVFLPNYPIAACRNPWGTAVADFTGDEWEDILTACRSEGKLALYVNNRQAEFPRSFTFSSLKDAWKPLAIDLNKDGALDIVVASYSESKVGWHLNDKKGSLPLSGSVNVGKGPHHLISADWDGDGREDVGVVCHDEGSVYLLRNMGGTLQGYKVLKSPNRPRAAAVGDLDKDGRPDIVVGGEEPFLVIFYGKSGYTGEGQQLTSPASIWALDVGDVNKDGRPDIVIGTYIGTSIATFLNAGYGRWEEPHVQPSGNYNFTLYLGDFDKDGDLDVVTVSARDNVINVHLNDGKGHFSDRHRIGTGQWPVSLSLGDVNGDDNVDFITTSVHDHAINVHRNIPVNPPKPIMIAIKGRLIDGETGEEVAGNITLIDTIALERADARDEAFQVQRYTPGKPFRFEVTGGRHILLLRGTAPNYPPVEERIVLPKLKDIPDSILKNGVNRDLIVRRVQRLKVFGYVTESAKNTPLANATVRLTTQSGEVIGEVLTNAKGYYEIQAPVGLNHHIQAEAQGYEPSMQIFSLGREHYPQGLRIDLTLSPAAISKTCIEGSILNQNTRSPVKDATIYLIDRAGTRRRMTSHNGGNFKGCLPAGFYYVEIIHKGFFPYRDSVEIPEGGIKRDFLLSPVESEKAIVLRNIYFDYDKATLRPESIEELERVVRFLRENPSLRVEISGHTDSDGSEIYNLRLSQARAQAVVDYLISRGIDGNRLVARGYGESRPVAPNDTPENKQKNRRTELKILSL